MIDECDGIDDLDFDELDYDDEFTGLDDGLDYEDDCRVCSLCGEPVFKQDGQYLCDFCGPLDESEVDE